MNLNVSINLLKMKAAVADVPGRNGNPVRCVILPIEANDLYAKTDESGHVTSVYLSVSCFENKKESQYGDTHMVKQSHGKAWNEAHTDEQKRGEPILGNGRPIGQRAVAEAVDVPKYEVAYQQQGDEEALPF